MIQLQALRQISYFLLTTLHAHYSTPVTSENKWPGLWQCPSITIQLFVTFIAEVILFGYHVIVII
jgi:hypothetical protein